MIVKPTRSDPSSARWPIRPATPRDEGELSALFERAFGAAMSASCRRWKLGGGVDPDSSATTGRPANVWVATDGEELIFQYAGVPTRMWIRDALEAVNPCGSALPMLSVDTMADPAYRRQGLLTSVGAHAYAEWEAAGVPFVFGLPNEQWGSRAAKLGWQPLCPLRWLQRPALRVGTCWERWHSDGGVQVEFVPRQQPLKPRIAAGIDALWRRVRAHLAVSVVRDAQRIQWRYVDAPHHAYQVVVGSRDDCIVGYAAFRIAEGRGGERRAIVAEVFADHPDVGRTLLFTAIAAAREQGASVAVLLAVPGSLAEQLARSAGFVVPRQSFGVQWVPLAIGSARAAVADPTNWLLMGGDFDVC